MVTCVMGGVNLWRRLVTADVERGFEFAFCLLVESQHLRGAARLLPKVENQHLLVCKLIA